MSDSGNLQQIVKWPLKMVPLFCFSFVKRIVIFPLLFNFNISFNISFSIIYFNIIFPLLYYFYYIFLLLFFFKLNISMILLYYWIIRRKPLLQRTVKCKIEFNSFKIENLNVNTIHTISNTRKWKENPGGKNRIF